MLVVRGGPKREIKGQRRDVEMARQPWRTAWRILTGHWQPCSNVGPLHRGPSPAECSTNGPSLHLWHLCHFFFFFAAFETDVRKGKAPFYWLTVENHTEAKGGNFPGKIVRIPKRQKCVWFVRCCSGMCSQGNSPRDKVKSYRNMS